MMRRELTAGGEDVLLLEARSMREHMAQQLLVPEASASLLLALGIATMAIATIGLFGLVAFSVARRTREIGIRVAVGATTRQVVGQVVREAIGLVGVGWLVGLPAAGLVMRPFAQTLVGAGATGPWPYVAVSALLLATAAAASFVPARRAAGVNPTSALRCE
jgi:ABC-type antimicrobial peptide transport system permease subunit